MIKNLSFLMLAVATVCMSFMPMAESKYLADVKLSSIKWATAGEDKTPHKGTLAFKSGSLMIDTKIVKGGFFYINMQSLACTDISDAGFNREFLTELRDENNLNVVKYKESTIKVVSAKRSEPSGATDNYTLTLEVNLRGVKKSFEVTAKANYVKKSVKLTTQLVLPAADFGMVYDLTLDLDITANQQ